MPKRESLRKVIKREEVHSPRQRWPDGSQEQARLRYWIETLECGHKHTEFENPRTKRRVCYKCTPRTITPKPQGERIVGLEKQDGQPLGLSDETVMGQTALDRFVIERQEAEAALRRQQQEAETASRAMPPIPLDWLF